MRQPDSLISELSRRSFLKSAAAAGIAAKLPADGKSDEAVRPNIVYLHSHDSGRYLQPYGYNIPTPTLQRIADEGSLFRQAFSVAPTCSPSRAGLLTGQYPHSSGMLGLAHRGFALHDYRQHIVHTLHDAGYLTVLAGIQHVAKDPKIIGYDRILSHPGIPENHLAGKAAAVAPAAAAFLDSRPTMPFFLDIGFFETHREYPEATAEDRSGFQEPPRPIPDAPQTREDFARYRASARLLDDGVRQVLEVLERNGLLENTLIVSTTDHGISFPRMKCNLTDDGWGVSLIIRGPGIGKGVVQDAMVSQIDIFPTLCEYLGIASPAWLQGKSLIPLISGKSTEVHDAIFGEVNYHAAYEPIRAVRTARWKYIRRFGRKTTPVLPNCDDGPSKTLWLDAGWAAYELPQESLYDLLFDPTEHDNLASMATYTDQLQEMRQRLHRWMVETEDPLLQGAVAAPAGAVVNDANGISPSEPVKPA